MTEHPLNQKCEFISVYSPVKHVIVVSLDRPRKRNAINAKMWREIGEVFRTVGVLGDGCRCILLTGNGKGFCAGIDVSDPSFFHSDDTMEIDTARKGMSFFPKIQEMQACFTAVEQCPVPVVAAVHGVCFGAGIDLSSCADIRVCAPSSRFSVREVRVGLTADVGTLQRFPKIVGHGSRVRELCMTGEEFDATEAARIGFVSRVSKDDAQLVPDALDVCKLIAANSPVAVAGTKMSLNYSRDHSVSDGLHHVATHNSMALMTDDIAKAFMSRGNPDTQYDDLAPHSKL